LFARLEATTKFGDAESLGVAIRGRLIGCREQMDGMRPYLSSDARFLVDSSSRWNTERRLPATLQRPLASSRLNPDVITRNSTVSQPQDADAARGQRSIFPGSGAVHFSTRGEYGVRLMVELARHHGSGPASLTEMASHEALPRPYLEQLVSSLREAGLVTSTRGARGGYVLARAPEQIRMGEVIRALEGPIAPMVCASQEPSHAGICGRTGFCNVNLLWVKVRDAITDALDSVTLADLAAPRPSHPFHPITLAGGSAPAQAALEPAVSEA
jgi:Rrf2 family transcriptional regulator, cysteine metabolism repressor